jgi:hypothetical protein
VIRQTDRNFGLTFATVFTVIFGVAWWVFNALIIWLLLVGGIFLVLALVVPGILMPLNRLWAAFSTRLAVVSNHVILGAFFLIFIIPVNLVMRMIGRDTMHRSMDSDVTSYWTPVNRQAIIENLPDMF